MGHFQMCDVGKCISRAWERLESVIAKTIWLGLWTGKDAQCCPQLNPRDGTKASPTILMGWGERGTRQMALKRPTVSLYAHGYTKKKEGRREGLGVKPCLGYPGREEIEHPVSPLSHCCSRIRYAPTCLPNGSIRTEA